MNPGSSHHNDPIRPHDRLTHYATLRDLQLHSAPFTSPSSPSYDANLSRDATFVTFDTSTTFVHTYVADVTYQAALTAALEKAVSELRVPEDIV